MGYKEQYMQWLESDYMDEATKEELRQIAGDEKEIEERFYTELEFGTAVSVVLSVQAVIV